MSKTTPSQPSCDDYDPNSLTVAQALERMKDAIEPINETESLPLMDALHHVLAEEVHSPINVPPYMNSAMDGYAMQGGDLPEEGTKELKITGTSFAGIPFEGNVSAGECIRIMTGAKMPAGADTVVMQEHTTREEDVLTISAGNKAGQNVRQAGEDVTAGGVVLLPGKYLQAAEIGLLASLGVPEVKVKRRLRVAFFSTGDELRAVGEKLEEGQIYDSNRYSLFGMLKKLDVEIIDLGVIRDKREDVEAAFIKAAEIADAVLTSGGVSVGDADYVKEVLDKLGEVNFWKIAMKPGRPFAFGKVNKAWFFGLPGNPVSVMATFYQFALPALRQLMGQAATPTLTFKVSSKGILKKRPGRVDFQRGVLERDDQGNLQVSAAGMQASHILSGMSKANCFIILPEEAGNIEAGMEVEVQVFEGLM